MLRMLSLTTTLLATAACDNTLERPMDEVPNQITLPNGDRSYGFRNDCVIILQAQQAVVKSESAACELYHRDITLLYASGD